MTNGRSERAFDPGFGDEGRRIATEIAVNNDAVGMGGFPSGDEFVAEFAAVGARGAGAGVEVEEGGCAHGDRWSGVVVGGRDVGRLIVTDMVTKMSKRN